MANNPVRKIRKYDCRNGSIQLSRNLQLPIHHQKSTRNANVLLVGSAQHANETIRKNIINADTSLIIFDDGGHFWKDTRSILEEKGFRVSALFCNNQAESLHYNPLVYVSQPEELSSLTDILTRNPNVDNSCCNQASTLIYLLVRYMMKTTPKGDWSFAKTYKISCQWLHDDNPQQALNSVFNDFENNIDLKQEYDEFMAKVTDLPKVCLYAAQCFLPFIMPLTEKKFNTDSLYLCSVGEVEKDVLFIITDEEDNSYHKIIHMLWQQLYDELYERDHSKPIKVLIPNMEQYGELPQMHLFLLTLRYKHICAMMHIHSTEQLARQYPNSEDILGDCDSCVLYDITTLTQDHVGNEITECYDLAKESTKIKWPWRKEPETKDVSDVVAAASELTKYCMVCIRGYTPAFDFQL